MLKIEQKTFNVIDIDALTLLINQTYGFPSNHNGYNIPYAEDIQHAYGAFFEFSSKENDKLDPVDIKVSLTTPLNDVITDLARKGLMPYGKFLIWIEY